MIITTSDSFARPADTDAYTATDLIANSTTAASVVPLTFTTTLLGSGRGVIRRARLFKDDETSTMADFILHLFSRSPTVSAGDNAQFNNSNVYAVSTIQYWLGALQIDLSTTPHTSSTDAIAIAAFTNPIYFDLHHVTMAERRLYGLLEANDAYTPASGETFEVTLEISEE